MIEKYVFCNSCLGRDIPSECNKCINGGMYVEDEDYEDETEEMSRSEFFDTFREVI